MSQNNHLTNIIKPKSTLRGMATEGYHGYIKH